MRSFIFFIWAILCSSQILYAQNYHDKTWVFGKNTAVDFSVTPPISYDIRSNKNNDHVSLESDANVCNRDGNLLFYTNGNFVLDRYGNRMPNGNYIVPLPNAFVEPTSSTSQGTIIIPIPKRPNKFLIFSLTCQELASNSGRLYSSLVDMNMNGGFGDVVVSQRGILIDTGFSEHMTAMLGSCEDDYVWLVLYSKAHNSLVSYKIDSTGIINSPIYSPVQNANLRNSNLGVLTPHPSFSKLAFASFVTSITGAFALFDFDKTYGIFSNETILDESTTYSCCFSPDGSKLYYTPNNSLAQLNLSLANNNDIINSKYTIHPNVYFTDIKLALDGNIYFKSPSTSYALSRITNINMGGSNVRFEDSVIVLDSSVSQAYLGLPNLVVDLNVIRDTLSTYNKYIICKGDSLFLEPVIKNFFTYEWEGYGNSGGIWVKDTGIYVVKYLADCDFYKDTFHISFYNYHTEPTEVFDTFCANESYTVGSIKYLETGIYNITFKTKDGCDSSINLNLFKRPISPANFDISTEGVQCIGDSIWVNILNNGDGILWLNNKQIAQPAISDYYQVSDFNNHFRLTIVDSYACRDTLSRYLDVNLCCEVIVPNAFSPNDDGLNDYFKPNYLNRVMDSEIFIFDRFGTLVYQSKDLSVGWDGKFNGKYCDLGVYFFMIKGKCLDGSSMIQKGDITLMR